jgi:hypothetical protein
MKKIFAYSILAVAALFLYGCAGLVDEQSVLSAMETTKQEEQRTKRAELKTKQFEMYYTVRAPEAESLAVIAAEGGRASKVAAAGVSSAAPPGAVFSPAPPPRRKRRETLVAPAIPDPVCSWAPVGIVCPQ